MAPPSSPPSPPPLSSLLTSPFPLRLLLVRHGESAVNLHPELIAGRSDSAPLTPRGELQARTLSLRLRSEAFHPHLLLSSTAVRAASTASLLYPDFPLRSTPTLLEQSQGKWTGLPRIEVHTSEVLADMDRLHIDFAAPEGESIRQAGDRALRGIGEEIERWRGERGEEGGEVEVKELNVAVVAHGMIIRGLLFLLCGLRPNCVWRVAVEHCSITEVSIDRRGVALHRVNDHSHSRIEQ